MRYDSVAQWLSWQETCHPVGIDLGLERVSAVAQRLGLLDPQAERSVVLVAGTNGKGSCVKTMEQVLLKAGKSCGAFTSPHILTYNERICINGVAIDDQQLLWAFDLIDRTRGEISLTYFEFSALSAMVIFQQQDLSYWLLEVGLGGRLDATNILPHDVSVITSIDLDHIQWLGNSRESIGREKAGICRRGKLLVCADPCPPHSIRDQAQKQGAIPLFLEQFYDDKSATLTLLDSSRAVDAEQSRGRKLDLAQVQLPKYSIAAGLACLNELGVLAELQLDALQVVVDNLSLAGRFQRLTVANRPVILDVAHNEAAIVRCVERISQLNLPVGKGVDVVMAMMADKDLSAIFKRLSNSVERWFLCSIPGNDRAATALQLSDILLEQCPAASPSLFDSVESGFGAALQNVSDRPILVVGSFYTVAAILDKADHWGEYETVG